MSVQNLFHSPFFSVIIPTYNRANLLKVAIKSVLEQTFEDWEIIVIDDGSVDETQTVVSAFSNSKIKYIYQSNQKESAARNKGIRKAKGRYICFLDDDDYYLKHHLKASYEALKETNFQAKVVFSSSFFDEAGQLSKAAPLPTTVDSFIYFFWKYGANPMHFGIASSVCKQYSFLETVHHGEDFQFLIRIVLDFPTILTHQYTCVVRQHSERATFDLNHPQVLKMIADNRLIEQSLTENYEKKLDQKLFKGALKHRRSSVYAIAANKAMKSNLIFLGFSLIYQSMITYPNFNLLIINAKNLIWGILFSLRLGKYFQTIK